LLKVNVTQGSRAALICTSIMVPPCMRIVSWQRHRQSANEIALPVFYKE
jgi:hypothetical protein